MIEAMGLTKIFFIIRLRRCQTILEKKHSRSDSPQKLYLENRFKLPVHPVINS